MDVYETNGFANREEYLDTLAEEHGHIAFELADLLGPTEDFDGLVTSLEDVGDMW
jgi:hypothetical protein